MMRWLGFAMVFGATAILGLSCSSAPVTNIDWTKIDQKAMIKAMGHVVETAADSVKPSVFYIEMNRTVAEAPRMGRGGRGGMAMGAAAAARSEIINGIVLHSDGYIIIPDYYEKNSINWVKVWIDEVDYPATVVDADKDDDITIIKVTTDKTLTPARIGDSNKVAVGDYLIGVQALGKDANFEKTASFVIAEGIIEGKSDLFLTSGAAGTFGTAASYICNLDGEIVGSMSRSIITAFNEKRKTAERLVARSLGQNIDNEEQQPWKGFTYTELSDDYAAAWGFPPAGVLVDRVYGNSAAGQAGLKREDVIIAVNDQPLTKKENRAVNQFEKFLAPEINHSVKLKVLRDRPAAAGPDKESLDISFQWNKMPKPKEFTAEDIGLQVREITDIEKENFNLFIDRGVVVTQVIRGSSAATSSSFGERLLYDHDVIIECYGVTINTLADFVSAVEKIRADKPGAIMIKLQRGNKLSHVCLNLEIGRRSKD